MKPRAHILLFLLAVLPPVAAAGPPPPAVASWEAHASCLAFEFSSARQRIVINCGVPEVHREMWRQVARSTAAHSTAVIADTSSCRFLQGGSMTRIFGAPIVAGPKHVEVQRGTRNNALLLRASHDGYAEAFNLLHQRSWRLALEGNRPRVARQAAEIISKAAAVMVDEVNANAARFLKKRAVASARITRESVVLALIQLAKSDPDGTASILENHWSVHLSPEQRSWVWGVIGKQVAQRLSGDALPHFAKAKDSDLNDSQLGWKVRAALRQGQWKEVLSATQVMSAEAQQESVWVYWRARALSRLAKTDAERSAAKALYERIASVRGFYEHLALEELGQSITVPARPEALSADEKQAAQDNAGLQRALYAIRIGLRSDGVREWNYCTNLHTPGGMSDRELLAAADLACQNEVWDRCINTSERTKGVIDFEQRFPMPHKNAVLQRATQIGLDPAYVYGLIRQESRFIMDAHSGVGAAGLMQIMPPTARWTAKKIGLSNFKPAQINDRDTNIVIGTAYLKLVLDNFDGSMPMAAAAYNAGPSRPRSWRGQSGAPLLDAAIWAENVPFSETRDYVKKVLSNTTNYAALISAAPQSLKARLGLVGPRDASATEPNEDLP